MSEVNVWQCRDCYHRSDEHDPLNTDCNDGWCPICHPDVVDVNPKELRTVSATGGEKGTKIERYDLVPVEPLRLLAKHYGIGAQKYAPDNWRKGYEWSKNISALMRHFEAWRAGQDFDVCPSNRDSCQEPFNDDFKTCFNHTGSPHLVAVVWHAFTLDEFSRIHPEYDDRIKS